jgi:hypothetical protein
MNQIRTRILVDPEHRITGTAPADLPPGEHEAVITIVSPRQPAIGPFNIDDLPSHDLGPWPEGLSLRREDIYGDDGR